MVGRGGFGNRLRLVLKGTAIKEDTTSTEIAGDCWSKMGRFSRLRQVCNYLNSSCATVTFTDYISGSQEGTADSSGSCCKELAERAE